MALVSGIYPGELIDFDEVTGLPIFDNAVDEDWYDNYHMDLITDGVFLRSAEAFQVVANDGMTVRVTPGSAHIKGKYGYDPLDFYVTLAPAHSTLNRYSLIVIQLDRVNGNMTIVEKIGENGSTNFSEPELVRNENIWELAIARIKVIKTVTSINQANIADLRPLQTYCGWVAGVMDPIDATALFVQFTAAFENMEASQQAYFTAFMDDLENVLSGDVAGNLLTKINDKIIVIPKGADIPVPERKVGSWYFKEL